MSVDLWDILEWAGYIADTPGALTRGALAGRPGQRVGGREMLEDWGLLGANQEGIDTGDVLGLGAEFLLDPLNLLGGAGLWKGLGKVDDVARANTQAQRLLDMGAMPEDIARATRLADEAGTPARYYHGTAAPEFGIREFAPDPGSGNWMGKGTYFTDDPGVVKSYQKFDKSGSILPGSEGFERIKKAAEDVAAEKNYPLDILFGNATYDESSLVNLLENPGNINPENYIFDHIANNIEDYYSKNVRPDLSRTHAGMAAQEFIEEARNKYDLIKPPPAPRTMMAYIDSRKPFDLDAPVGGIEANRIIDVAAKPYGGSISRLGTSHVRDFANKLGDDLTGGDLWNSLLVGMGHTPDDITDVLRNSGYDSLVHGPGTSETLERLHGVPVNMDPYAEIVPFSPSQIYAPYIAPNQQARPIGDILAALLMGGHNTIARSQSGVQ